MGWEDRPYYRDRPSGSGGSVFSILMGSVRLFTLFGIRVRILNIFIFSIAMTLFFGLGPGFTWQDRVQSMAILFGVVLLHEFGHCFTARWVGGEADEIIMHPFGGLAQTRPPKRPLPVFLTVAGGPAVNVVLCLVCGTILYVLAGQVPWNPLQFTPIGDFESWLEVHRYASWIYQVSWMLLIFNLLPIYPLDGGQMLQAILWPKVGYYKSMNFSCIVGMIAAVLAGAIALATLSINLTFLALFGFITCYAMRQQLLAAGPYAQHDEPDYSASLHSPDTHAKHKTTSRAAKQARKRLKEEQAEQARVDAILEKVSTQGMHSLTWWEKRALHKATERQRERDAEMAATRSRRGY